MTSDRELMEVRVAALFTHVADARIRFVNEPWADAATRTAAPRFFLGRTAEGNLWRFRADVPDALVDHLQDLCFDEPPLSNARDAPRHVASYLRLLAPRESTRLGMGPAYRVPAGAEPSQRAVRITEANAAVLGAGFDDCAPELDSAQPFVGIVSDGRAVSICRSVRIGDRGHEAGVETLTDFRGRGFAPAAVAAWAAAVEQLGCVALYSTSWENTASQRVAGKVGAVFFGADFHVA